MHTFETPAFGSPPTGEISNLPFTGEPTTSQVLMLLTQHIYGAADNGEIRVVYIQSAANPANTHTAAENRDRFVHNTNVISGLAALPS